MPNVPANGEREERIAMEVIVDAYVPEEQALGWYTYLEEHLTFPFSTRCVAKRAISPLQVGDDVEIVGMAPQEECAHETFVETPWGHASTLAVSLSQIQGSHLDEETRQAVEDWHYWVARGNEL